MNIVQARLASLVVCPPLDLLSSPPLLESSKGLGLRNSTARFHHSQGLELRNSNSEISSQPELHNETLTKFSELKMLPRWSRAVRSLNSITQRNDFHAISRQSYAMATAAAASVEPAPRPTKQPVVSLDKMFWSKPASLALAPDSPLRVDEPKYEGIKRFILKLMLFYSKQSKSIRGANVIYKRVVSQVDKPAIYDVFNLEKTFRMTFSLLVLHMWFCLRRLKEDGKEGVELGQYLYEIYNHDVEMRVSKAGVNLLLSKWMKELEKIFYGNIVAFDAALLPEAKQDELQNVIWRNIFSDDGSSKPDDAALRAVQAMTRYVRREMSCLFLTDKEAMFSGNFMFTPLENTSFGPVRR